MSTEDVRFVSFGGLSDVGSRNSYGLILGDKVHMLDCGQVIPPNGVSLSKEHFPDFDPVFGRRRKVETIFVSHAHLDHIGGLNHFFELNDWHHPEYSPTVFASPYTARIIAATDKSDQATPNLFEVQEDYIVEHDDVRFEFFPVIHSILDSFGCVVEIAGRRIAYLGDVKMRGHPEEEKAQRRRFLNLDCDTLLLDATGVERQGSAAPNHEAAFEVIRIIAGTEGRVVVTQFASNVERLRIILSYLHKYERSRPIFIKGSGLENHLRAAGVNGWRPYTGREPLPENAVLLATGAQGETRSGMRRLVDGELGNLSLTEKDTIVFSASTIPKEENQLAFRDLLDEIKEIGSTVYLPPGNPYDPHAKNPNTRIGEIHASGHGFSDDLQEIVELINPKQIIPVHADIARRNLMRDLFPDRDIVLPCEGEEVVL